jgi:isocitrate dehydrogenase
MSEKLKIALAPGDGIGPEIMDATIGLLREAGVEESIEWAPVEMGQGVFAKGETRGMTDDAIRTTEACGLLFKGPMGTPSGGGGKSINVTARKMWGAFANLRHFQSLPGVETVYSKAGVPVDFYVVRENVEDTYGGIEHRLTNDVVECKRLISAPGCDQVSRFAFREARRFGIRKVHCGHKANIMKLTDGLFLERFRAMAEDYPEIETDDVIIDALCMGLVQRPHEFEMVVLPNLQGDIVSDLAAGLVGGLGFAPSANIGTHISIFEAVHGTAPDIAGRGIANPTALILSSLMLLRHIGMHRSAAIIENALLVTLEEGIRTGDFGDKSKEPVGTQDYARAIIERLGSSPKTVEPKPVPEANDVGVERAERPHANELIRTFTQVVSQHVGCDIYIETTEPVLDLAKDLSRLCEDTPFKLTLISNRGTQVWPSGSVFTDVVDYYRVRFEAREGVAPGSFGQGASISLLRKVSERYAITDFQPLRNFDGKRGFSLAQGQ